MLATFFVALPIGIYFLHNMGDFIGRAGQTSVFATPNPPFYLTESLILHLQMFNFIGDGNWRHNLAGEPELFCPVGLLFLLGLALAIKRLAKSIKTKEFGLEFQSYSLLLLWFFFLLLPGALTFEGIPHSLRTFGVIPPVMVFSALGGVCAYDWLKSRLPKIAVLAIAVVFIATCAIQGYWEYFIAWADNPEVQGAFTTYFVKVGQLTSQLHDQGWQTMVIVNENGTPVPYPDGLPMPDQTVMFTESADCYKLGGTVGKCVPYSKYLAPNQISQVAMTPNTAIVPMKDDQQLFDELSQMFPEGQIKQINNIRYYEINQ